jgi:Fis family transcriptional regulator
MNSTNHLLVANLHSISLEKLVRSKLEILFEQQSRESVELQGLYEIILETKYVPPNC